MKRFRAPNMLMAACDWVGRVGSGLHVQEICRRVLIQPEKWP